jgi:hypothetical protein
MTLDKWQDKGCPRADDMLRSYTLHLMADCKPPEYYADLMDKGEAFIKKYLNNSPKASKAGKTF